MKEVIKIDRDYLEDLYINQKVSMKEISQMIGCCNGTILRRIHKYNIPIVRNCHMHLDDKLNSFSITDEIRSYIDGLIMSDGYISNELPYPRYSQQSARRYENWLINIKNYFNSFNIKCRLDRIIQKPRYIKGILYPETPASYLQTISYPQLKEFRDRWYPEGKKIIPDDIDITPQFLSNWYLGDGSYSIKRITFYTDSFTEEEIDRFIDKLNSELDIHLTKNHRSNKPIIRLNIKYDINLLLEYMKPHIVDCFKYKWG